MPRTPAIALLLLLASSPAAAQSEPYTWHNAKIVAGGFIPGILFHPTQPNLAYCRTDMGGVYRLDSSSPQWQPITDWVGPATANLAGCESIALVPNHPNLLYLALGTYSRGKAAIARSTDRGNTFQLHETPFTMGANEDGRGMGERLAVDPHHPDTLFFGTRHDGLWTSTDAAATWHKVDSFPTRRPPATAPASTRPTLPAGGGGISFVLFDPLHPATLYAGRAEPADDRLFRSTDSGHTWSPIPHQPAAFLPHRAAIDSTGTLYITYSNAIGPNGITAGAIFKFDTSTDHWTDITPPQPPQISSGFGGLALDPHHPGTLLVSTIDRWNPGDEIYRTTDSGASWKPLSPTAHRDASLSPYLLWGQDTPRFGWWLAALAIDPFDSNHALYGTGATIWGTHDLNSLDADQPTHWSVAADGIEETAILALISPPEGPPLISGMGDLGSFTHNDLTQSPPTGMHENPHLTDVSCLDFAQLKPATIVRAGTPGGRGASRESGPTAAISHDFGITWKPLSLPAAATTTYRSVWDPTVRDIPILSLSADASTVLATIAGLSFLTTDEGQSWKPCENLPLNAHPIADRLAPTTFYSLDLPTSRLFTSTDGGLTFTPHAITGIPPSTNTRIPRNRNPLKASYAAQGDLYILTAKTLYHSTDAGLTFSRLSPENASIHSFALGKPAPDHANLTLFIAGTLNNTPGLYRSTDDAKSFSRINDDQHFFGGGGGGYPTVMAGDPRTFGRLYLGMNGRGILYGDPSPPSK